MTIKNIKTVDIDDVFDENFANEDLDPIVEKKNGFKIGLVVIAVLLITGAAYSFDFINLKEVVNGNAGTAGLQLAAVAEEMSTPPAADKLSSAGFPDLMPSAGSGGLDSDFLKWESDETKDKPVLSKPTISRPLSPRTNAVANPSLRPASPVAPNMPSLPVKAVDSAKVTTPEETVNPMNLPAVETNNTAASPEAAVKIEELNKRIADLEKLMRAVNAQMVKGSDLSALDKRLDKIEKELSAPKNTQVIKKVVKSRASGSIENNNKDSVWVLRSAKPGMAWLSKKGSNDLVTVSTGDTLLDVGKITEITKSSSGSWVVKGDKGSIFQ